MIKQELMKKQNYKFEDLLEIIELLRAPDGCPWDREQTHQSIRKGLIEETYEVVEGIDKNDDEIMCEELGDLLLQVVFHASIASSDGRFDIDKICDGICKKLIYRHPHVFGDIDVENSEEVLKNWDELKKKEKGQKDKVSVLEGVSKALPSLMRAQKLIKKSDEQCVENDSADKIAELAKKLTGDCDKHAIAGELLFECARLGNSYKLDLEQSLYDQNEVFLQKKHKNI